MAHNLSVAKRVTIGNETFLSESTASTDVPRVIVVEYLPQNLIIKPVMKLLSSLYKLPERSLSTDLSKDPLIQQPNNTTKTSIGPTVLSSE